MQHTCTIPTPIGNLTIREEAGALCAITLTGDALSAPTTPLLTEAARQLDAYFAGTLTSFDLPLHLADTPFRLRCWEVLRTIPYGQTISYGEQAQRAGNPRATRAVGGANHHNPILIVIPCHRVIGTNGALTGFGYGVDVKAWLLAHEQRHKPSD